MATASPRVLNVNVGILGHVDCGKTSLVAALSTKLSTAALDKHPQSKERGITLDLGFSSFTVDIPAQTTQLPYDVLQFTLVDCPGHASLIRTIIGGAQIIDMMVLVIDVTKGLQAQTAECLVVGEIATQRLVVVLNKTDLLPAADRDKLVRKAARKLAQTFNLTKFAGVPMVPVCAKPGGEAGLAPEGIDLLRGCLVAQVQGAPRHVRPGPLLFAIDHCFPIRGQGTVLTGTVLQGAMSVGEVIELPQLRVQHKIKSMQMFKMPVQRAQQGDRVGVCVSQLDPNLVERGLACAPGTVPTFTTVIARVEKIRFYAGPVSSKAKFHISVGHHIVMGQATFFGLPDGLGMTQPEFQQQTMACLSTLSSWDYSEAFDFSKEYLAQSELHGMEGRPKVAGNKREGEAGSSSAAGAGSSAGGERHWGPQWALLKFEQPVTAPKDALMIGAKFDLDHHGDACRLAFYGRILAVVDPSHPEAMARLKVYKLKEREGVIERVQPDGCTAIVRNLIKKESDVSIFTGLTVVTTAGNQGVIEGSFGKSGKVKVMFPGGIAGLAGGHEQQVILRCKKFLYDQDKRKIRQ